MACGKAKPEKTCSGYFSSIGDDLRFGPKKKRKTEPVSDFRLRSMLFYIMNATRVYWQDSKPTNKKMHGASA